MAIGFMLLNGREKEKENKFGWFIKKVIVFIKILIYL